MKDSKKSVFEKLLILFKKNVLVFSTLIFIVILIVVAIAIAGISKIKDEKAKELAYAALSDEEKALLNQNLTLVKDAYPEVNKASEGYLDAIANKNLPYLKEHLFEISTNEIDNITVKSNYIDYYDNITCYTQEGYEDDSYYVYVTYDLHIVGFEEGVPSIIGFYYAKDSTGVYRIFKQDSMSSDVVENFYIAYMQQDVQNLYNQISLSYNETLESDEKLKDFMDGYDELIKNDLVTLIAERIAEQKAKEEEEKVVEGPVVEQVEAVTSVNVRASDSETAERLGTVGEGTVLTRLEAKLNGWSRVQYEGREAYIKTEYLNVVGGAVPEIETQQVVENTTTTTTNKDDKNKTETKYVTANDNVNIRAEADIDSERVGFAYNGDKLELIEKLSNGWTKIKYNNKECYVKSDYVQ
ncbi:MAG: SH3 domain-containing protein [Lachnospiraceae bacterium]|nr:SH3 domain-containing protein [Lachnospiraceae bacterium]